MKRFAPVLLLMACLAFTFSEGLTQVPKTLSYQGVLTDTSGTQVPDGQYQVTFNLYDQQSGGSSLWAETQTTNVEKGVFSVLLGKIAPLTLSFDTGYWLGIAVDGGTELSPRTELAASAYSLNAAAITDSIVTGQKIAYGHVLRSLNGLTDQVNLAAGPNIIISPQGDSLVIAAVGGSGASPWQVSGNNIYYSLGKVGIGTSSPSAELDVNGNFRIPTTGSNGLLGVILSDTNRFIHRYGSESFFAGLNAGNFGTTGERNTGVGSRALLSNTTGTYNTAVGAYTLDANSTGSENTALGVNVLTDNTTGGANTAIGTFALKDNVDGNANTATGAGVMLSNTSGSNNTAMGVGALGSNTTGTGNTAIGSNANVSSGALTNATAIGANATVDASNKIRLGNNSVNLVETAGTVSAGAFIGDGSGLSNLPVSPWQRSGNNLYYQNGNVGIGITNPTALVHTVGSGSTPSFLSGSSSADFAVPDNQPLQFGHWDGSTQSFTERMRLTNTGDVGIGTSTPGIIPGAYRYLTVSASQSYLANRTAALELQGSSTGGGVPTGRIDFGANGLAGFIGNIARIHAEGGSTAATTGELVFFTNDGTSLNEAIRIIENGDVGIGTASPLHPLHMGSGAHVTSGGVWTNASSRSYKENIHSLSTEAAIATLEGLEPVSFNYIADKGDETLGFIAEDVPDLVATRDRKGISAMDIVAVLTKVVKQQQKRISELESRMNEVTR